MGISRLLKENDDRPLAGQLYVVPNIRIAMDHWTDDMKKELTTKAQDPSDFIEVTYKPLKDFSFLEEYFSDPLQFNGPHFAKTIDIAKELSEADYTIMKEITHPIHISYAEHDYCLDNSAITDFFEAVSTPDS